MPISRRTDQTKTVGAHSSLSQREAADAAAIGHNRPPLDVEARAAFDEALAERAGFADRCHALVDAAARSHAVDEESAGRCGDLVRQLRAAMKAIDDAHVSAKGPYLQAGRAVDAARSALVAPLEAAKREVEAKQAQFLREETARREAEGEPTFSETEKSGVRIVGDLGATVSTRTNWVADVTDYALAFGAVTNNAKVREAIDRAVAALVRSGVREIPGVTIRAELAANNR